MLRVGRNECMGHVAVNTVWMCVVCVTEVWQGVCMCRSGQRQSWTNILMERVDPAQLHSGEGSCQPGHKLARAPGQFQGTDVRT